MLGLHRGTIPNADAVNLTRALDAQYKYVGLKEVPGLGDAAYWTYHAPGGTRGGQGVLRVFQGGTTILSLTSLEFPDEPAELEKAKKLVLIALGASGKTGYVYAPPGKAPQPSQNPQTAAGSSQGSKGSAKTESQFLSDADTLRDLKAFSVTVVSDDVKVEPIKNRVSQALRDHGITVLADGTFPKIWIAITTTSTSVNSSTRGGFSVPISVIAYSLTFEVVRPIPVGAKSMLVSTNTNSSMGVGGPLFLNGGIQEGVDAVLKAFFRDYGAR